MQYKLQYLQVRPVNRLRIKHFDVTIDDLSQRPLRQCMQYLLFCGHATRARKSIWLATLVNKGLICHGLAGDPEPLACYLGLAIRDWLKRHDNEEPCFWNSPWHTRRIEVISEVTQQLADRQPKVLAKGGQRALEVVVAYIVFSSLGAVRFAHVWSLLRLPHHPPFTHPPTYRHRFTRGKTYDWVGANAEHF